LSCPVRTGVSGVACLRSLDFFLVWLGEFCHLARLNSTNKSSLAMNRTSAWRKTERASALVKGLVAALVALGLVAGVIWHFHHGAVKQPGVDDSGGLSDGTRKVLKNLDSPVTIRFYTLLDKASVSADTFVFAERVNDLLAEYQQAGDGKISVTRLKAPSDAESADADGIKPFNLDKGDACYLGLSVSCKGQKESFPRLSADWEQALEADLSRAIARLSATQPNAPAAAPTSAAVASVAAVNNLKLALTNLADVTVEEGSRVLRVAAFQDYSLVATEMQAKLDAAHQRLVAAQNGGSEAGMNDAMNQLQQVQAEQAEKLGKIAAQLQSRITTLEQIKKP